MNMTLWKNYVVMACCIALPSHATATVVNADYRCVTPELTAMLVCDMTQLLLDLLEANLVYTHAHTHTHTHTHINRLRPSWILSMTAWVSWCQKVKTRKVKPIWIYHSKR